MLIESQYFIGESGPVKLSREQIDSILEATADPNCLQRLDLTDLKLVGSMLAGRSFRACDVRGLQLGVTEEEQEQGKRTDIRESDWTEAVFASVGPFTDFRGVEAGGAKFGFEESLVARRKRNELRYKQNKMVSLEKEIGGYFNFDGRGGKFERTIWNNIDFGGESEYQAMFDGANLKNARFNGCDLRYIDLSSADCQGISIYVPDLEYVRGMKININQLDDFMNGIILVKDGKNIPLQEAIGSRDPQEILVDNLNMEIVIT